MPPSVGHYTVSYRVADIDADDPLLKQENQLLQHVHPKLEHATVGRLSFYLNGERIELSAQDWDLHTSLNDYLRLRQHGPPPLRATKIACGEGGCGACAVVISKLNTPRSNDGHRTDGCTAINSCLRPLASIHEYSIITVEGLGAACAKAKDNSLHPIQARISAFNASQCGYCTPGFVASLYAQLHAGGGGQDCDKSQLARSMDGNICRCTGYRPIVDAATSFTCQKTSVADLEDMTERFTACTALDEKSREGAEQLGPYEVAKYDPELPKTESSRGIGEQQMLILEGRDGVRWYQPKLIGQLGQVLKAYPAGVPKLIAGNTSTGIYKDEDALLNGCRDRVYVSLQDIDGLHGHQLTQDGNLVIGGGCTLSDLIATIEQLPAAFAAQELVSALLVHLRRIAGTLVRNTASLGGNLHMARVKVFDSDLATVLAGLGTSVGLVHLEGQEEEVDLLWYLQQPKLDEGEAQMVLIKKIRLPLRPATSPNHMDLYRSYRVSLRKGNSHAFANAAFRASVDLQARCLSDIRVCFGALGMPVTRVNSVEQALRGQELNDEVLQAALTALRKDLIPAHKDKYKWRIDLVAAFLYKFIVAARLMLGPQGLDARIRSAAMPQTERTAIAGKHKYSRRWMTGGQGPNSNAAHTALSKDYRGTQASGEAVYVSDTPAVQGTLHSAYVKSPRAAGVLQSIQYSEALRLPGVHSILTAADIPGANDSSYTLGPPDVVSDPILVPVGGRVSFHCQPVALIIATSPGVAEEAAKKVIVEFEGFEAPIITIQDALSAKSTIPSIKDQLKRGDADAVLETARQAQKPELLVSKGSVKSASQKHFYLEPQSAYAIPDEDRLSVYSGTQAPQCVQEVVARSVGLPMNAVHVRVRRVGGAFGGKATRNLPHAAAVAVAARVTRRPVRMTLDRHTDMQLTGGRHAMEADFEVAFEIRTGKIQALKAQVWFNAGFYNDLSFTAIHDFASNVEMAYFLPNVDIAVDAVRTNLPSSTTMRGPGVVQASLFMESVLDHVASVAKLTPEDVRLANFLHGPDDAATMQALGCSHGPPRQVSHFTLPDIWQQLSKTADLAGRRGQILEYNVANRWRKRGVAVTPVKFHNFLMPMAATVNAYPDGSILIHHGGCEIGQGIHTKSALTALQVLSNAADEPIRLDMIRFADTDTDSVPNGGYTAGSTTSERACAAVCLACEEMVRRLIPVRERLREQTGHTKDPLPISWTALVAKALSFGENIDLCCHGQWRPSVLEYYNYGAALSEVEVDVLTGEIEVRAVHLLYDCGRSINPAADLGQVEGAFTQGLGFFLLEEATIGPDGALTASGTWEYKPPMIADLPTEWNVQFFENGNFDKGVLSSKASGEPPLILATSIYMAARAAIRAARVQACLSPVFKLDCPATPERIHRACGTSLGMLWLEQEGPSGWLDETPRRIQVAVAGAGLGGLAVGITLNQMGIDAALFERAPALRDVSQGLVGVTPNGLRALELINPKIKRYLLERGKLNTEAFTKTYDDQGGTTERIVQFEAHNVSIPWADIQHSLARLVPSCMINCSHDFVGFDEDEEGVTIFFRGRLQTVRADLFFGVDGLFSAVRKGVVSFPNGSGDEVCESGHTNWNAIMRPSDTGLPYPHPVVSLTYYKQPPPRFFFMIECGHGRILWQVRVDDPTKDYTVAPKKGHGRLGMDGVKKRILQLVEEVPDILPYIQATPEEMIFERCLLFRKSLMRYSTPGRRTLLLGDAAHAMHSVRGQGANMCFEDAYFMLLALQARGVGPETIRLFERARIPRANLVQWESNTYYKRQFEKNTSHTWALKFLNFQSYVRDIPESINPELLSPGEQ